MDGSCWGAGVDTYREFCVEVRRNFAFRYFDYNIKKVDGIVRNTGGKFDCRMIVVAVNLM